MSKVLMNFDFELPPLSSPQTPYTMRIHQMRFITLNSMPVMPVAERDVNSSANQVKVKPF